MEPELILGLVCLFGGVGGIILENHRPGRREGNQTRHHLSLGVAVSCMSFGMFTLYFCSQGCDESLWPLALPSGFIGLLLFGFGVEGDRVTAKRMENPDQTTMTDLEKLKGVILSLPRGAVIFFAIYDTKLWFDGVLTTEKYLAYLGLLSIVYLTDHYLRRMTDRYLRRRQKEHEEE
ncbi:MAG: hypothetical protein CXX80_05950 [Methanobacteriota archaeon]|nr:MAG: hypothetical protein CXX81_29840 [Euryarchaeota archaeon]PXY74892.1 MAG: hypothetical protein CXX80_05950 [Euryarchaeota archaeon]PXY78524.1 MAG: hypothetical protein CXX81_07285 [Euryarchaeota archaeon]